MRASFRFLCTPVLSAFLLVTTAVAAQAPWIAKADIGTVGRSEAVSFSIGTIGYVATGTNASGTRRDLWAYDQATNAWTQKANLLGARRRGAIAFVIGNKAYVGTGWSAAGSPQHDFYEYDPATNFWTAKADYGNPNGLANGTAFAIGTKGYVLTGGDNITATYNQVWEYDQPTDTWTQKNDFAGFPRENANAFTIGSTGYLTCGMGQSSPFYYNDLWAYNQATDTWTEMANMGVAGRRNASCFVIGNEAYIVNGFNNLAALPSLYTMSMYAYNAVTNTWAEKPAFPGSDRCWSMAFSIGSKGYVGGGAMSFGPYYNDFYEYTNICEATTVYEDADGDGYGNAAVSTTTCDGVPAGYVINNTDCNDVNSAINPGATEVCNAIDDDCNGTIDIGLTYLDYYIDADSDGYGDVGATAVSSCSPVAGSVTNNTDCNDANAAINPGVTEVCNGIDDDCDGISDDGLAFLNYYTDADGDGYGAGSPTNSCAAIPGKVTNNTDCNDANAAIKPSATEVCNGIDDNCDGVTDPIIAEPIITALGPTTLCEGESVELTSLTASNALQFDGVNDRVLCGNDISVQITGTHITLEAWIYPTSWQPMVWQGNIINKEQDAIGNDKGYMLRAGGAGQLNFAIGNGASWHELTSPAGALALNTWQHVAATYDGSYRRIYINGVLISSVAGSVSIGNAATPLVIGDWSYEGSFRPFPGIIDEVRVWNITKSGAAILADMYNEISGDSPGLMAYYTFNEGGGITANDQSVNSNNGTLSGGPVWEVPSTSPVAGGDAYASYLWSPGGETTPAITVTEVGTYTVTTTDAAGCTATSEAFEVTLAPLTTYYADSDSDGFGNAATSIMACSVPTGYTTDITDCDDTNAAINPSATEVCNGIDDNCDGIIDPLIAEICNGLDDNCNGLIDDGVAVSITISAGGPTTFCKPGSVVLTATHTGATLQWKKNGVNIAGATGINYTASATGDYTCQTTGPCGTATSTLIHVTRNSLPTAVITAGGPTEFCWGESVVLTANSGVGLSYQWYDNVFPIPGATSINYTAIEYGVYKCRVTKTATGCSKNSNIIVVNVICREEDSAVENTFSIFPNPASDIITIETDLATEKTIYVTDALGQVLQTITTSENTITIDLNNISSGVYFIRMEDGVDTVTRKFIKQ